MRSQQRKDFLIVGIVAALFLGILIAGREVPQTDRVVGAKWCAQRGQSLDQVTPGKTRRPPYHPGHFKPKLKLTIVCKKKPLH